MAAARPRTIEAPAALKRMVAGDPHLVRLLAGLNDADEETRIVGGAIRNALLGKPVHDVDLATTLLPDALTERLQGLGFKAAPTGIAHGTVTAIVEGRPFEITTLRQDITTDGRRATVRFGRDFKADAMRRDFTINALFLDADGFVHDYTGGLADLDAKTVRFIGDPETRIGEDYLRILRFFRFSAIYAEGPLDAAGLAACAARQEGIETLSRERIGQEMRKLLVAERAVDVLAQMVEIGILARALDGPCDLESFARMVEIEHQAALPADCIRRLAALAIRDAGRIEALRAALKLSNEERDRLEAMMKNRAVADPNDLRRLIYLFGQSAFVDALCLKAAFDETEPPTAADIARTFATRVPVNPFRAADFIARGLKAGPELGQALKLAEQTWITAGFPDDRASLASIAAHSVAAITQSRLASGTPAR